MFVSYHISPCLSSMAHLHCWESVEPGQSSCGAGAALKVDPQHPWGCSDPLLPQLARAVLGSLPLRLTAEASAVSVLHIQDLSVTPGSGCTPGDTQSRSGEKMWCVPQTHNTGKGWGRAASPVLSPPDPWILLHHAQCGWCRTTLSLSSAGTLLAPPHPSKFCLHLNKSMQHIPRTGLANKSFEHRDCGQSQASIILTSLLCISIMALGKLAAAKQQNTSPLRAGRNLSHKSHCLSSWWLESWFSCST